MPESTSIVLVEVEDRVATVTLNRPEARNAINRALSLALWDAITDVGRSPAVDAVILTGADPAFCAGIDLKEVSRDSSEPTASPRPPGEGPERGADGLYRFLPVISKPIIGAINGPTVTGGLEVALQCTFLIASDRARFGDTHARVGVMPGGGLTVLLAQSIGLRRAIEMSLTGNFITAEEGLRLGLVNHVVAHDALLPFARRVAGDMVHNDQRAVGRLLAHYRRLARAASVDQGFLLEGLMAEMWEPGTSQVGARQADVTARGRQQMSRSQK